MNSLALHLRYSMVKSLNNVAEIKIGLRTPRHNAVSYQRKDWTMLDKT